MFFLFLDSFETSQLIELKSLGNIPFHPGLVSGKEFPDAINKLPGKQKECSECYYDFILTVNFLYEYRLVKMFNFDLDFFS